ncbi:MAG: hypothetical protein KC944_23510, partial [Candidatus Omnitrophica bacterium]|nr:hypothetical protein [Candidatus Omnitrophota bacterium]
MATVGLYNLLFSRVFESGSAVADVVAGDAKPAEGAKQLLPPAADFSTLIQSLLVQTPTATQESKVPVVEKTPGIVETETFLSKLFGHEVEVQPLGQIEGFEFFRITLGPEI